MTGAERPESAVADIAAEASEAIATPAGRIDRYGIAVVLISLTIAVNVLGPGGRWGGILVVGLGSVTLLFCLTASDVGRRYILGVRAATAIAFVATAIATFIGDESLAVAAVAFTGGALALIAPVAIGRRLIGQLVITQHTVAGALALYLLAGLFFSYVYLGIDAVSGPVFVQVADATASETTYFSFVTLATLGYGDFSPAGPVGRLVAIVEAVGAQVYLVTIVAVLVANIGRRRGA